MFYTVVGLTVLAAVVSCQSEISDKINGKWGYDRCIWKGQPMRQESIDKFMTEFTYKNENDATHSVNLVHHVGAAEATGKIVLTSPTKASCQLSKDSNVEWDKRYMGVFLRNCDKINRFYFDEQDRLRIDFESIQSYCLLHKRE